MFGGVDESIIEAKKVLRREVPGAQQVDTDRDINHHNKFTTLDTMATTRPETMFAWRKHKGNPEPVRARDGNLSATGG